MFGLPSLYLRMAGYGLAALLLAGAGYKVGASRWEMKYQRLQAADWQGKANRESAARQALEGQLAQTKATSENNAKVLHALQIESAAIVADRDRTADLVHRLLARAARSASHPVPEAANQPGAAARTFDEGTERLAGLLTAAATECRTNAASYQALIDQLRPQL